MPQRYRLDRERVQQVVFEFSFNFLLAFLFTILLTAPAIRFFSTRVFGYPHDGFEYMWRMWWTREALTTLRISPASLSFVNYPIGGYNPHIIVSPLINLLAMPLIGGLGSLRTYNAILFVSLVLSWPTAALLCREFTRERFSASVGGALYAFHANRMAHAIGGHLPQTFTFLFPIMALLLYRAWRRPSRRTAAWAGIVLALSLLVDMKHVGLFVAPFVGLFLVFFGLGERHLWSRERLFAMVLALGTAALITTPFFGPLVLDRVSGRLEYFYAPGVVRHSADLLGFVVPPPEHPLYQQWPALNRLSERLAEPGWHENVFYLGWSVMVLAVLGAVRGWRNRGIRFWILVAVVALVLALGPVLKVGDRVVTWRLGQIEGDVPLPYLILQSLPFYDWGRTPGRMITLAMLGLSVLTACGAEVLLSRVRRRWRRALLVLILLGVVVGDHVFTWPFPLGNADVPSFYESLARQPEDFAILDHPLWSYRCERYQLYYATVHEHRIVGGIVQRRTPESEVAMQQVERLILPQSEVETAPALAGLGIRYVVLHKLCLDESALAEVTAYLSDQLGMPVYDDRWIRAFEVPGQPTVGDGFELPSLQHEDVMNP